MPRYGIPTRQGMPAPIPVCPCVRRIRCSPVIPLYLCAETTHPAIPRYLSVPVGTTNSWYFCLLVQPDGQQSVAAFVFRSMVRRQNSAQVESAKGHCGVRICCWQQLHTRVSCGAPGVLCPRRTVHGGGGWGGVCMERRQRVRRGVVWRPWVWYATG